MSIESWKREFYPVSAYDETINSDRKAIEQSLLKWRGLTAANLKKHEVKQGVNGSFLVPTTEAISDTFYIGGDTCALCINHNKIDGSCQGCPITITQDGVTCDGLDSEEDEVPTDGTLWPWGEWMSNGNPKPMIDVLERCLKLEEAKP